MHSDLHKRVRRHAWRWRRREERRRRWWAVRAAARSGLPVPPGWPIARALSVSRIRPAKGPGAHVQTSTVASHCRKVAAAQRSHESKVPKHLQVGLLL